MKSPIPFSPVTRYSENRLKQALDTLLANEHNKTYDADMLYMVYFGENSAVCVRFERGWENYQPFNLKADDTSAIMAVKLAGHHTKVQFPEPFNTVSIKPSTGVYVGIFNY